MVAYVTPRKTRFVRWGRTKRTLRTTVVGLSVLTVLVGPVAVASPHSDAPATTVAYLYNSAQAAFGDGAVEAGLDALDRAAGIAPGNVDVLALRAFWASEAKDYPAARDSLNRLGRISPGERAGVVEAIDAIGNAARTPSDPFPSFQGAQTAIVVLGYGLRSDGSMRPELVQRLWAAWRQAIAAPCSPVITTGGNPHHGITEGQAMADWLIDHGIPPGRVHAETQANSTVQNALFTARIIRSLGLRSAVVVTSANHIRRGTVDFEIAGVPVLGATAALDRPSSLLRPSSAGEIRAMYLDATRVFGLPAAL